MGVKLHEDEKKKTKSKKVVVQEEKVEEEAEEVVVEKPKRKRSNSSVQKGALLGETEVIQKKIKKNKYVNMDEEEDQYATKLEALPNKLEDYIKDPKTISILKKRGVNYLFPIQEQCFKPAYAGKDIIGKDRTGSGKTIAFALPLIERFREQGLFAKTVRGQKPYILVLLPTRELAIQVAKEITSLAHTPGEFRVACIYGGTDIRTQSDLLRDGVEIVVGTPGRIMDQYERKSLSFNSLRALVLDEADQMLQVGFQEDIQKIYKFVTESIEIKKTQNLLFSATIPSWLHDIAQSYISKDRVFIDLIKTSAIQTSTTVEHLAINCPPYQRTDAMGDVIMCYGGGVNSRCIIFCETKREANDIMLDGKIKQDCQVLHGDIPQKQREITFQGFRDGKFKCLIATNVAARGLDIPAVDLIVQTEPPKDYDTYIHRSGRTARAGRSGVCITFYTKKNQMLLERIERRIGLKMKRVGAPQPEDLLKASSRDIVLSLRRVSKECSDLFKEVASELIEEVGAEEALARAISFIAGYTEKMKQRSLLCSMEGFVTYMVKVDKPFRNKGFVWAFLKRAFTEDIEQYVKGMKMFRDACGAVFDVSEEQKSKLEDYIAKQATAEQKSFITLELVTGAIPELADDGPATNYQNNQSFNNNGYQGGANPYLSNRPKYDEAEVREAKKIKKDLEVFVGRVAFGVTEDKLRDFFKGQGIEFYEMRMLKDESGNFKGCCFCLCKNTEMVQKACKLDGTTLEGRKIVINMADQKSKK